MGDLGAAIITAMRDQGWLVVIHPDVILAQGPAGPGAALPVTLFEEGDERRLRVILLSLVVVHGLVWPWPPDVFEDVHGETPRFDV